MCAYSTHVCTLRSIRVYYVYACDCVRSMSVRVVTRHEGYLTKVKEEARWVFHWDFVCASECLSGAGKNAHVFERETKRVG